MKKILLTLVVTLFSVNSIFAQDIAKKADGIYNGKLWINLMSPIDDESEPVEGQEIKIFPDGENTVTFALYNFMFGDAVLGDIVLPNVPVTESNGKLVFGTNEPKYFNFESAGIEATAQLNSTTSFIETGRLYADIDVIWTNGGNVPIYVRFDGNKTGDTGIANVSTNKNNGIESIYNFAGVRMSVAKGLCIKNGKKAFVK